MIHLGFHAHVAIDVPFDNESETMAKKSRRGKKPSTRKRVKDLPVKSDEPDNVVGGGSITPGSIRQQFESWRLVTFKNPTPDSDDGSRNYTPPKPPA